MMAVKVDYQLVKGGEWLEGIGISTADEPAQLDCIIAANGKPVAGEPWDFRSAYWHGLIIFGGF